jgi:hypothetical protein
MDLFKKHSREATNSQMIEAEGEGLEDVEKRLSELNKAH